jgi:hypothetical protein
MFELQYNTFGGLFVAENESGVKRKIDRVLTKMVLMIGYLGSLTIFVGIYLGIEHGLRYGDFSGALIFAAMFVFLVYLYMDALQKILHKKYPFDRVAKKRLADAV